MKTPAAELRAGLIGDGNKAAIKAMSTSQCHDWAVLS